jgi:hypothetical protein
MSQAPVNPVAFMQDVVVDQGTWKTPKTKPEQRIAFRQMLAEQVFLKNTFDTEDSVFKPDQDEDALFSPQNTRIYNEYMKKQMAAKIVQSGFLNEVDSGK